MSYRIIFGASGWLPTPPRDEWGVTFDVFDGAAETRCLSVSLGLRGRQAIDLFPLKVGATATTVDDASLGSALKAYALPRIEAGLRDGSFAGYIERGEHWREILSPDEARGLPALLAEKQCRYLKRGEDDFCRAGYDFRRGEKAPSDRVNIATTPHLCRLCTMPDGRVACSMLHHVTTWPKDGGIQPTGAECAAGKKNGPNAAECRPGGYECWHRLVEPQAREEVVHLSPLTLHEALGYLDTVWRDAVKKGPLLVGDLLTAGGMLATPCKDLADFKEKVKGLVDAFDALQVPDERPKGGKLARMQEFLEHWASPREGAADDLSSVREAITVLQKVARIRAYYEHSDARARSDFEPAQRALGIRLPAVSYREEWNTLVARVTDMLRIVREFLRKHAQGSTERS